MPRILLRRVHKLLRISTGFGLLMCGLVLFFTPGPGWIVILSALGVLAADFLWARRVLAWMKYSMAWLRATVFARGARHAMSYASPGHFAARLFKSNHM